MEIKGNNSLVGLNPDVQRIESSKQVPPSTVKQEECNSPAPADRVELSAKGREIQGLSEMIQSTPDTRDIKIEQIRNAIENGTYNVKAENIADKILSGNLIDDIF